MNNYAYSREISEVVDQYLQSENWHYSFEEKYGIFRFGLNISARIRAIDFVIDIKEDELLVYGLCPLRVDYEDSEMMARMAEFICRANYGLKNGCFELDFDDGEIRYKSFVDCEGGLPSSDVISNSIHCTSAMYRRYSAGIVGIIFEGISAKDAISRCEKALDTDVRTLIERLGEIDSETMEEGLARLAEKLGITMDDDESDDESGEDTGDEDGTVSDKTEGIMMDLFAKKEDEDE